MSDQDKLIKIMGFINRIGCGFFGMTVSSILFYWIDQTPTLSFLTFTYIITLVIAIAVWAFDRKLKRGDES